MIKKEYLKELKRFTTPLKDKFSRVLSADDFVFAANGHVLAWTYECSGRGVQRASGPFIKSVIEIIKSADYIDFKDLDIPAIKTKKCNHCKGKGIVKFCECKECKGDGKVSFLNRYHTYNLKCKGCKGKGEIQTKNNNIPAKRCNKCTNGLIPEDEKHISVNGVMLDASYLSMVNNYPDLKASFSSDPLKGFDRVYFKSSNNINCAIMAIRT